MSMAEDFLDDRLAEDMAGLSCPICGGDAQGICYCDVCAECGKLHDECRCVKEEAHE